MKRGAISTLKKKWSQLKSWELYFIWWEFLRLQAWETASQESFSEEEARGGAGYREGLQKRAGSLNIKRVLDKKKKKEYWELRKIRYPRLRNLAVFYVWEDARVWAGWNHSFYRLLSYSESASCVFTSWAPWGLTIGSSWSLMTARSPVLFSFLDALGLTMEGCNHGCLWHPCLLIRQEVLHLSSSSDAASLSAKVLIGTQSSLF